MQNNHELLTELNLKNNSEMVAVACTRIVLCLEKLDTVIGQLNVSDIPQRLHTNNYSIDFVKYVERRMASGQTQASGVNKSYPPIFSHNFSNKVVD